MENMKKVPKAPAATEISPVGSWSQLHPTFVPDSLMYLNNDGECVFLVGDMIDSPNVARVLEATEEVN